jgi:hypothetical protein
MINKGDIVRMIKAEEWLAPMNVGELFTINEISYGVAIISSNKDSRRYYVSTEVLEEYYEKYEEPKCNECCDDCCECDEEYDNVLDIMDNSEFAAFKVFDKCAVVACKLPNGFVIVEASACVDPDKYNDNIAIENCLDRIESKIATMEAYRRCDEMYERDEFFEDDEDCAYNDLDCDDCEMCNSCSYCTNND